MQINAHAKCLSSRQSSLDQLDERYSWHPFSQTSERKTFPPIHIKSGEGCWLEDEEGNRLIDPPSSDASPDEGMVQEEDWRLVGEALAQLGGACQEILELRYFGDLSYHEISAELEINEKTVSSRLSKCKGKLETVMRNLFSRRNMGVFPSEVPSKG